MSATPELPSFRRRLAAAAIDLVMFAPAIALFGAGIWLAQRLAG